MTQLIFLSAILQEKIWGGSQLHTQFGFDIPSQKTGEAWVISAHPNGTSIITEPKQYAGIPLNQFYSEHPELFNNQQLNTFPLLIKILDACDNLSIQVHPDDTYALKHEGELGKNECWYILSAQPGAKIIYGHTAKTIEEFNQLIDEEKWGNLFVEVPVKAGDFFNVPSGTIHAIGKGITLLETQQNSDTTYRVFDYHRSDDSGKERPLHIQQTKDVTTIPHHIPNFSPIITTLDNGQSIQFIENQFFSVWRYTINGQCLCPLSSTYHLVTIIEGVGSITIDGITTPLQKSQSFILPSGISQVIFDGDMSLIMSQSNQ